MAAAKRTKTAANGAGDSGRVTKHQELTRTLLEMARSLLPGDPFPSQAELMRRFGVSDRTVLRSLDDLQHAGWITRRHGVGTFVADPKRHRDSAVLPHPAVTANGTIAGMVLALGPVYQHFIDLVTEQTEAAGLAFVCQHIHAETGFDEALPLEALNPRGFVLFSYYLLPIARRLMEKGHRVIIVGAPPAGSLPEISCVYNDQDFGGYQATRHLIDLGHRRIAYVAPETRYSVYETLRWQGHQRAIEESAKANTPLQATAIDIAEWLAWRDDPERCAAFFARPDAPTGLLTWNDAKAAEILHILYRAGVRVPQDVSVVGYDALPVGAQSIPPITTIDSQIATQVRAVMQFLTVPSAPPINQSVVVTPSLLRRASTIPWNDADES